MPTKKGSSRGRRFQIPGQLPGTGGPSAGGGLDNETGGSGGLDNTTEESSGGLDNATEEPSTGGGTTTPPSTPPPTTGGTGATPAEPPVPAPPNTPMGKPGSFATPGTKGAKAFRTKNYGVGRQVGPRLGMRYTNIDPRTGRKKVQLAGGAPPPGLGPGGLQEPNEDLASAIKRKTLL